MFIITMQIIGSPKGMLGKWRTFVKEEMQKLIFEWHQTTAPRHFTQRAASRYGYQKRKYKYARRKSRRGLAGQPLVYSGRSKKAILRTITVTGSYKQARGTIKNVPRYFWETPPGKPKKGDELFAVTQKEADVMVELLNARVTRRMNGVKDKKKVA